MRKGAAVLCLFFSASSVQALEWATDGASLLRNCLEVGRVEAGATKGVDFIGAATCMSYLEGYTNALVNNQTILKVLGSSSQRAICLPDEGIRNSETARLVVRYLQDHSDLLKKDKSIAVFMALDEAYPCK